MKKHLLIGVVGLSSLFAGGQNLVPNGSFEQFSTCPIGLAKINYALNWYNPAIGVNVGGNGGTPDYFNQCATPSQAGIPNNAFGYQQAYSGNAYGGLALFYFGVPDFREYIESDIVMPLLANGCYHFEMYVNLANTSKFSTEFIFWKLYFSN